MRNRDLHFELPSFEDLKSSALKPPSGSKAPVLTREMNVIAPVAQAGTLKVAAYCRVSTDKEDQQSSIQIQQEHFSSLAKINSDWHFVGINADIISGTKKEKRPELRRLLADCAAGKISYSITVSGLEKYVPQNMLPEGTESGEWTYTLEEAVPSGYYAHYLKEGQTTWMNADSVDDGGTVENHLIAAELPATGGPGTRLFAILGSILALGAGYLLWRRHRLA